METNTPLDDLYAALAAGDIDAARKCFTADAQLWHSFDGVAQDVDAAAVGWSALVAGTAERGPEDVRRHDIADGFVQQHVFVVRSTSGQRTAWPVCLVVRIKDGRISHLAEYMDRAGSFSPADGAVATPGF